MTFFSLSHRQFVEFCYSFSQYTNKYAVTARMPDPISARCISILHIRRGSDWRKKLCGLSILPAFFPLILPLFLFPVQVDINPLSVCNRITFSRQNCVDKIIFFVFDAFFAQVVIFRLWIMLWEEGCRVREKKSTLSRSDCRSLANLFFFPPLNLPMAALAASAAAAAAAKMLFFLLLLSVSLPGSEAADSAAESPSSSSSSSSYGSSSSSALYKKEKYSFEDDDVDKGGTVSKGEFEFRISKFYLFVGDRSLPLRRRRVERLRRLWAGPLPRPPPPPRREAVRGGQKHHKALHAGGAAAWDKVIFYEMQDI